MIQLDIRNIKLNTGEGNFGAVSYYGNYNTNRAKAMCLGDKQVWPKIEGYVMITSDGTTTMLYRPDASYSKTPYLEYSYDTVTWSELIENTTLEYDIDHPLYLRGKNNQYVNSHYGNSSVFDDDPHAIFNFSGDKTRWYGSIMYLLNYDRLSNVVPMRAFEDLFWNQELLAKGPDLTATYLYEYAYSGMFSGCTALEEVPQMAEPEYIDGSVFEGMFADCTSLTEGILLGPSKGSVGIVSPSRAYRAMYIRCTSLRTVKTNFEYIPITSYGFDAAFKDCIALEDISWFKVNTTDKLGEGCFRGMFTNCTSLTYVPDIQAGTIGTSSLSNTFEGCTNLVTAPRITSNFIGPKGCFEMFKNCTSLTSAPFIGPISLYTFGSGLISATQCYENMFYGCSNLNYVVLNCHSYINNLGFSSNIINDANICFKNWLYGVSATGTLVTCNDLPDISANNVCPEGWSISKTNLTGYKDCQPK